MWGNSVTWRNFSTWEMWGQICHVENFSTRCFVALYAIFAVLSRFTRFGVEKNWAKILSVEKKGQISGMKICYAFYTLFLTFDFLEEKFAASCILLCSFSFWGKLLTVNLEISLESDPGWAVDADLSNAGQMFCHALVKFNHDRNRNWILSTTSIQSWKKVGT